MTQTPSRDRKAPTCPRCKLPMKPGANFEYECIDGCGEWCFESPDTPAPKEGE